MSPRFGKDLTVGSIPTTLIKFAIPIFLANLLSSGYGIINTVWVGHLLGRNAVAAAALAFPIILLMVAVCSGATTVTSVLIAQYYGAKQDDKIQKVVNTSWTFSAIIAVTLAVAGILGADALVRLMDAPLEIHSVATSYLRLIFAIIIFMYCSFLVMSSLRAVGNTKVPLLFVVIGTICNAVLDPLLIKGLGPFPRLGLDGAAIASLISGAVTAVSGVAYLKIKFHHSPLFPKRFALDKAVIWQIAKIGFPSFMQQALFSLAVATVTTLVNGFGATATAAFGIANRIDTLVALPALATLVAVSTVTAQNLGAHKPERIREVFKWGLFVNAPAILLVSLICLTLPSWVMRSFVKDPEVIRIGIGYFRIMGFGYLFLIPPYVSNGIIIGSGKTIVTMLITFISLCLVRIPLASWLSHTSLGITGIWIGTAMSFPVHAMLSVAYYLSGKWKRTVIETAKAPLGGAPATPLPTAD